MIRLLFSVSIICGIYFVILCIKQVDFCIIWLISSCFSGLWGSYLLYRVKCPAGMKLPGFFIGAFLVLVLVIAGSFLFEETRIFSYMIRKPQTDVDFVIVLGAQVKKVRPSRALLHRIEKAAAYMNEDPQVIAVLSGGQGDGEEISEAQCMYQCLLNMGISEKRILLEDRSTTTKENLLFSEKVIDEYIGMHPGMTAGTRAKKSRVALISNNFHIYRAVRLARKQGYWNVTGIAAPSDYRLQIHYLVREYFAIISAIIKGDI